jgi:hypothetical protein
MPRPLSFGEIRIGLAGDQPAPGAVPERGTPLRIAVLGDFSGRGDDSPPRGGPLAMAKSIIAYDKDLPEIPGRLAWRPPTSFLVKDPDGPAGWHVDTSSRRPSALLLVRHLRAAVDQWREQRYPGASEVTQ